LRRDLGEAGQSDAFDHSNVIGWVRRAKDLTVVVLMSNGEGGVQRFDTGRPGVAFADATGAVAGAVVTDARGGAEFRCPGRGVSIWVARGGGTAR
jgi:hypothetical protein